MTWLIPPLLFIYGAVICLFVGRTQRAILTLLVPAVALISLLLLPDGNMAQVQFLGFELVFVRLDKLAFVFSLIFIIAALLAAVYAWHMDDKVQQVATLLYAGAAIGGVLAGDLLSLFLYWEITAVASVFLIWARRTPAAYSTGMRYLIIQVGSGVLLLAGLLVHYNDTGSIAPPVLLKKM